jgi:ribose-phosphate pyrophosphokinase
MALPGADACAKRLAERLQMPLARLVARRLPDGERYLRVLDDVRGREVVVVAHLRDPDPQLPGLLFLAEDLRELGAASVGLVAPYLPYMRHDIRSRPGEAVTSRSFAKWISAHFDWLVTVDPHLNHVARLDGLYRLRSAVVPSAAAIALWIQGHVKRPHIVGPDEASEPWAAEVADYAGCAHSVLHKVRLADGSADVSHADPQRLRGATPVLIEDVISTAQPMAAAVRQMRAAGLAAPVCVGVHAVFADGAEAALQRAGAARVVTCNTLPHDSNAIDVTGALAEAVRVLRQDRAALRAAIVEGPGPMLAG